MHLYDTLTRSLKELDPPSNKPLKLYTCGPTVYNHAHIGNLRAFIFDDVLERSLKYLGYQVDRVMNITDVGHLTSDADEGEDKLDKAAAKEKLGVEEVIAKYTELWLLNLRAVNAIVPEKLPRASKYIAAQLEMIQILLDKGFAYDTPEAIYFDTSKLSDYGKLSGQDLNDKAVAVRAEVETGLHKKQPYDFALWFKLVGRFEHHLMHWPSPWGEGFPGWHLECSALIHEFLGEPIDIHAGGVDHIGTHHTNEIAQSEAAFGVPLSKIWIHNEHLLVDGAKMSKSLGNFYILEDLVRKGFDPLDLRYLCLTAHYRTKLNFTWEGLAGASAARNKLIETLSRFNFDLDDNSTSNNSQSSTYRQDFREAIQNDLNTPKALAVIHEVVKDQEVTDREKAVLINEFGQVLGIDFKPIEHEIPREVLDLAAERELCRQNKQFTQSDDLRARINALGYVVEDTASGPIVRKK